MWNFWLGKSSALQNFMWFDGLETVQGWIPSPSKKAGRMWGLFTWTIILFSLLVRCDLSEEAKIWCLDWIWSNRKFRDQWEWPESGTRGSQSDIKWTVIVITCPLKVNDLIMLLCALASMKHRSKLTEKVRNSDASICSLSPLWNVMPIWHAALIFLLFSRSKFACSFNINVRLYALIVYFLDFTKSMKGKIWALRDKSGNHGHLVRNGFYFSLPLSTELNKQTHPNAFKIIETLFIWNFFEKYL